ncbi:MAG: glycerophosphodiester phosphodiesterase [Candidatus Lokiarchaeota archaeon]|nr:glycerophosphodiester phosphodiesterase [Candidatus Lokiarchaeota archaeon]
MKPYIFGHRGASGYEVENTIPAFEKAVSMGVGIETDVQLTKDNKLVCFHDPHIKIEEKYCLIKNFTLNELRAIKFEDSRYIPLAKEVFDIFKGSPNNLRYSFDILDKKSGIELLNLARKASLLNNIEITDRRLRVLSALRRENKESNLAYTLTETISTINSKTLNLDKLRKLRVNVINIMRRRNIEDLFRDVIDNGFKCYIWGVNTKTNMKRIIKMRYKDKIVNAIYTNYPDILLNLIMEHFK